MSASLRRVTTPLQIFPLELLSDRRREQSVEGAVAREFPLMLAGRSIAGKMVGISIPSRGIPNRVALLRAIGEEVRRRGGTPVGLPGIGSHGGRTGNEQLARLAQADLGITPENIGMPISDNAEVLYLGTSHGVNVWASRAVLRDVDLVVLFNRVLLHTDILWEEQDLAEDLGIPFYPLESGLVKMLAVGHGGESGATAIHSGPHSLGRNVQIAARFLLDSGDIRQKILGGIAVIDNAYDQTALVNGVPFTGDIEAFFQAELALLLESERYMMFLPRWANRLDLLFVRYAGKSTAGQGVHLKKIGRGPNEYVRGQPWARGMPKICTIVCSRLLGNNAMGRGKFQLVSQQYADAMDEDITRRNAAAAGYPAAIRMPQIVPTDRDLVECGLGMCRRGVGDFKVAFVVSTLWMQNMWASANLLPRAKRDSSVKVLGEPRPVPYTADGALDLPDLTTRMD